MGTVFTLDGIGFPGMLATTAMASQLLASAQTSAPVPIPYDTYVSANVDVAGASAALDAAFHSGANRAPFLVLGIGLGTQVMYKWLRDYGPSSTVDPSDMSMTCLAPPEVSDNGVAVVRPDITPTYGGVGVPSSTPYTVVNLMRQYDGVCDYPNLPPSPLAYRNAWIGMTTIHGNYLDLLPSNPNNVSFVSGTVSYHLNPTPILPLVASLYPNNTDQQLRHDGMYRPGVEECYQRVYGTAIPLVAVGTPGSLSPGDRRIYSQ